MIVDFESVDGLDGSSKALIRSKVLFNRVAPPVGRDLVSQIDCPAFEELLGLLPVMSADESAVVLSNALALARAFASRRGPR